MKNHDRIVGLVPQAKSDRIEIGWTAIVSPQAINVIFPNRYWTRAAERVPVVSDGRSVIEFEIDGLCDAVKRSLLAQVKP